MTTTTRPELTFDGCGINGPDEYRTRLATIPIERRDDPEVRRYARLMAAAPELLALVRQAFDRFTDNDMQPPNHALRTWLDSASATIAKATGN